jgi:nucleotide-binding universal stress UspA family protein
MDRRILVPFDKSVEARKALEFALEQFPDADVTALYVIDPVVGLYDVDDADDDFIAAEKRDAEESLSEATAIAAEYDHAVDTEISTGKPAAEIVEYAIESESDQIVIGSHGRSGLSRILLGSVAESVARRAPVPVTIVR